MTSSFSTHVLEAARSGLGAVACDLISETSARVRVPLRGAFAEPISIWVERSGDRVRVSDGGDAVFELRALGVDPSSQMRLDLSQELLRLHGFGLRDGQITGLFAPDELPTAMTGMVDSLLQLGSAYYSTHPRPPRRVTGLVSAALANRRIQFERRFEVVGASSLIRRFDFRVVRRAESLIRTLSTADLQAAQRQAELFAFHAEDIRRIHTARFRFLLVWDDARLEWPEDIYRELEQFEIAAVPVSEPAQLVRSLAA